MRTRKPSDQNNIWTRTSIELLLSELRKGKTLYDQRHPDYLNRTKSQMCLEIISKALLDKLNFKVSNEHVKNEIQILRAQLSKDIRGMLRSKKYKPKFWCFKKMERFKPYVNNCYSASALTNGAHFSAITNTTYDNNLTLDSTMNGSNLSTNNPFHVAGHIKVRNQSNMTSTTTLDEDAPMSSSNILTSKMVHNMYIMKLSIVICIEIFFTY